MNQDLGWNINNRYDRVLTSAVGMGGGPDAKRTIAYYFFPSLLVLNHHEHALAWAK